MSTLVIAEHDNSSLKKSVLNTITAASAIGEPVDVLIAGADCQAAAAAAAAVAGVRAVIVADGAAYLNHLPEAVAPLVWRYPVTIRICSRQQQLPVRI